LANYSTTFGSSFPEHTITLNTHKDVDDTVVSLINQYNTFVDSGDMASAYALYEANKTALEPYNINTAYIDRLEEEIYNTGLCALSKLNSVFADTESAVPSDMSIGSYWMQPY